MSSQLEKALNEQVRELIKEEIRADKIKTAFGVLKEAFEYGEEIGRTCEERIEQVLRKNNVASTYDSSDIAREILRAMFSDY